MCSDRRFCLLCLLRLLGSCPDDEGSERGALRWDDGDGEHYKQQRKQVAKIWLSLTSELHKRALLLFPSFPHCPAHSRSLEFTLDQAEGVPSV